MSHTIPAKSPFADRPQPRVVRNAAVFTNTRHTRSTPVSNTLQSLQISVNKFVQDMSLIQKGKQVLQAGTGVSEMVNALGVLKTGEQSRISAMQSQFDREVGSASPDAMAQINKLKTIVIPYGIK